MTMSILYLSLISSSIFLNVYCTVSRNNSSAESVNKKSLIFVYNIIGPAENELKHFIRGVKTFINRTAEKEQKINIWESKIIFFSKSYSAEWVCQIDENEVDSIFTMKKNKTSSAGILKALEISSPNSYIYVFTNAKLDNPHPEISDIIRKKKIQVVIAINQLSKELKQYESYNEIAILGGGQVINLTPDRYEQFFEYIRNLLPILSNKVDLMMVSNYGGNVLADTMYTILIDKLVTQIAYLITITDENGLVEANKIAVDLKSPNDTSCENNFTAKETAFKVIHNPCPGVWKVNITNERNSSPFSIRIFAASDLDFVYGFSTKRVTSINNTTLQVLTGITNFIYVASSNATYKPVFTNCDLWSINGSILENIELEKVENATEQLYYGEFKPTIESYFHLQICGVTDKGKVIKRVSSTLLSAIEQVETQVKTDNTDDSSSKTSWWIYIFFLIVIVCAVIFCAYRNIPYS